MWQSTHSEDAVRRRDPARELRVDVPRVEREYANVLTLETLLECVRVEDVGEFAGAPGSMTGSTAQRWQGPETHLSPYRSHVLPRGLLTVSWEVKSGFEQKLCPEIGCLVRCSM